MTPNRIVASGLYAVVSTDGGCNWYVFVPTCGEEEWIRSTFPGYPYGQESTGFVAVDMHHTTSRTFAARGRKAACSIVTGESP
jgi:hypothetical protein